MHESMPVLKKSQDIESVNIPLRVDTNQNPESVSIICISISINMINALNHCKSHA